MSINHKTLRHGDAVLLRATVSMDRTPLSFDMGTGVCISAGGVDVVSIESRAVAIGDLVRRSDNGSQTWEVRAIDGDTSNPFCFLRQVDFFSGPKERRLLDYYICLRAADLKPVL